MEIYFNFSIYEKGGSVGPVKKLIKLTWPKDNGHAKWYSCFWSRLSAKLDAGSHHYAIIHQTSNKP